MNTNLIVVATEFEARFLFHTDSIKKTPVLSGWLIEDTETSLPPVLVTGIGKTNSAMVLTHYLTNHPHPSHILNTGICGAFREHSPVSVGDVAVATEECYGDEGVVSDSGFLSMKDLGFPLLKSGDTEHFNTFPFLMEKTLLHF